MTLSNEDNGKVQERNQNDCELDQTVMFYFLDHEGKLRKTHDLPKEAEHFVWESRRTLKSDEFLFTLAYSRAFEDYETVVADQDDFKEYERERIAGSFLGLSTPSPIADVSALDSDGNSRETGMDKSAIDSILRDIRKLISINREDILESIVMDCGFSGTFLLHCKRSKEMPAFKLIWRNGAYHIYAKERGDAQEIKLGAIRTSHDADLFCELYERVLLLNSEKA
jgi:hypothetical protein